MTIGEYIAYGIQIVFAICFIAFFILKIRERIREKKNERYEEIEK
jgi:hypothetical protein